MIDFIDRSRLGASEPAQKPETMLVISCERSITGMTPEQIAAKREHERNGGMVILKPNQGVSSFEFLNKDGSRFTLPPEPAEERPWREWSYEISDWVYN